MRAILTILLMLIFTFISFGQIETYISIDSIKYYHVIGNDTVNGKIPTDNNYSGFVEQMVVKHGNRITKVGLAKSTSTTLDPFVATEKEISGEYLNGNKVGKWEYVYLEGSILKTDITIYKNDTIIFKPSLPFGQEYYYVRDSSIVYGILNKYENDYEMHGEKILFRCEKKEECVFMTADSVEITRSDYSDLKNTINMFESGRFDRKIRKLKE